MSERRKKTDPKTVAALLVATCGAVGFASWSITRALNPPAQTAEATSAAPGANAPAAGGANPGISFEPVTPPVAPDGGAVTMPVGSATTQAVVDIRPAGGGEVGLAPNADPFTPIPTELAATVASNPSLLPARVGGSQIPALPAVASWRGPGTLLPLETAPLPLAFPGRGAAPPSAPSAPAPRPAAPTIEPAPPLTGTLLGDIDCALFTVGTRLVVVPVGETIGAWRVMAVDHGSATLRHGKHSVRRMVGEMPVDGIAQAGAGASQARAGALVGPALLAPLISLAPVLTGSGASAAVGGAASPQAPTEPPASPTDNVPVHEPGPPATTPAVQDEKAE